MKRRKAAGIRERKNRRWERRLSLSEREGALEEMKQQEGEKEILERGSRKCKRRNRERERQMILISVCTQFLYQKNGDFNVGLLFLKLVMLRFFFFAEKNFKEGGGVEVQKDFSQ